MLKAIRISLIINTVLCILLSILLYWGFALGGNRLWFKNFKEVYPGPITITACSFPFGVYCPELFNNQDFQERYHLSNEAIDIPFVCFNKDTLYLETIVYGIDSVGYFRIVNPDIDHPYESVQGRIMMLDKAPDYVVLLNNGYSYQKLDYAKTFIAFILEPIIIFLIIFLSSGTIILSAFHLAKPLVSGKK